MTESGKVDPLFKCVIDVLRFFTHCAVAVQGYYDVERVFTITRGNHIQGFATDHVVSALKGLEGYTVLNHIKEVVMHSA